MRQQAHSSRSKVDKQNMVIPEQVSRRGRW